MISQVMDAINARLKLTRTGNATLSLENMIILFALSVEMDMLTLMLVKNATMVLS